MFKVGDRVTLVRHDQYPSLVGLQGHISGSGMQDPTRSANLAAASGGIAAGVGGTFYQVACETRTLHDVPEAWLQQASGKRSRVHA